MTKSGFISVRKQPALGPHARTCACACGVLSSQNFHFDEETISWLVLYQGAWNGFLWDSDSTSQGFGEITKVSSQLRLSSQVQVTDCSFHTAQVLRLPFHLVNRDKAMIQCWPKSPKECHVQSRLYMTLRTLAKGGNLFENMAVCSQTRSQNPMSFTILLQPLPQQKKPMPILRQNSHWHRRWDSHRQGIHPEPNFPGLKNLSVWTSICKLGCWTNAQGRLRRSHGPQPFDSKFDWLWFPLSCRGWSELLDFGIWAGFLNQFPSLPVAVECSQSVIRLSPRS